MKILVFMFLLTASSPALSQPTVQGSPLPTVRFFACIPEPEKLTFGEKASDDWIRACEGKFRNPLPTCHRLYAVPADRELCLAVIPKIDGYYAQRPNK